MARMTALQHYRKSEEYAEMALDVVTPQSRTNYMQRAQWHAQMALTTFALADADSRDIKALVRD